MIKITIFDQKQKKGYFEYIDGDEGVDVGEDRFIQYNKLSNHDWVYGYIECLAQSDDCPYFIMMANNDDLIIEVENIVV